MHVFIFFMFSLSVNFLCSSPFDLPDRCTENLGRKSRSLRNKNPTIVPVIEHSPRNFSDHNEITNSMNARTNLAGELDILDLAEKEENWLKEKYRDYNFHSVPVRGHQWQIKNGENEMITWLDFYAPYDCIFKTQKARSLSSVVCQDLQCKLVHTVSTVETYENSVGYHIGAKVTTNKVTGNTNTEKEGCVEEAETKNIEIGGETSSDTTLTCSFTKEHSETETVECEVGTGKTGNLQLYIIKSDMQCNIGKLTMEKDERDGQNEKSSTLFNVHDIAEIKKNAAIKITCALRDFGEKDCDGFDTYIIDIVKTADRLLEKFKEVFPNFNSYTDTITILNEMPSEILVKVMYYRAARDDKYHRITVPFTNENGDAIYQYACILTPLYQNFYNKYE